MGIFYDLNLKVTKHHPDGEDVTEEAWNHRGRIAEMLSDLDGAEDIVDLFGGDTVTSRFDKECFVNGMKTVSEAYPDWVFRIHAKTLDVDENPQAWYFHQSRHECCHSHLVYDNPKMF